jgi:YafQ family addiction module toxin component
LPRQSGLKMYLPEIKNELKRKLKKLEKRNHLLVRQIYAKADEIAKNPHHYKPLRAPMQNKRRAHIGHFVLVFEIIETEKVVLFLEFEHHDNAYI